MTDVDLESIAHLDFDLNEDKGPKCKGWRTKRVSTGVRTDGKDCNERAKVRAMRACCGYIEFLCYDCYNANCAAAVARCRYGMHDRPLPLYCKVDYV